MWIRRQATSGAIWIGLALVAAVAAPASAEMVSYVANLQTSRGNPVTNLLILEADAGGTVRATVYPEAVPGTGTVVIQHDAPVAPVKSLLIGVTDGQDENGNSKTQLVMLLDPEFAAANQGIPFSSVFAGTRHSTTIDTLAAAAAGDAASLAWFTDVFFTGPAAGAVFDSSGAFAVAEFTSLKTIGKKATAGLWMINSFSSLGKNDPNAQSGRVTAVIDETAKGNNGPYDIELSLDGDGSFAIDKTVQNNTGTEWRTFEIRLGTGVGANFNPNAPSDKVRLAATPPPMEDTGAFPDFTRDGNRVLFRGLLPVGETAHFVVFVNTDVVGSYVVTVRQTALNDRAAAPALSSLMLVVLVALLTLLAGVRLRATR